MKLRMAENSLFAILLRRPWWVSALVALGLGAAGLAIAPDGWRVVGALSGFPFVVIAAMAAWRQRHDSSPTEIAQVEAAVRGMAWPVFADLLEKAFVRDGYTVTRMTGAVDLELVGRGQTMLVSARRWKSARTGVEPLRELQAAREKADAAALCIGLGEITDAAAAFARHHRIAVWGGAELARALRGFALPGA